MNLFKSLFSGTATDTLTASQAKVRLDEKTPLYILDVREPEEFRAGHIPGAKLIPIGELGRRMAELPPDREILCVCQSGSRSSIATRQLNNAGYKAFNLRAGMIGWQMAGFKVKRGA
jgi:rhodanese-related sulfurtransferase